MSITTRTLATIMLVTMLTLSSVSVGALGSAGSPTSPISTKDRDTRQLDRMYRHHDRKFELRASVLELSPEQLKEQLKSQSFQSIIKKSGFKDEQAFHTALVGKLKDELRTRGWSDDRIKEFTQKRLDRYQRNHS